MQGSGGNGSLVAGLAMCLNPASTTSELCEFGQVPSTLCVSCSLSERGEDDNNSSCPTGCWEL